MPRTYKRVRARYSPSWPCQRKNNRIIKRFSHHRTRALNKGANEVTVVASEKAIREGATIVILSMETLLAIVWTYMIFLLTLGQGTSRSGGIRQ